MSNKNRTHAPVSSTSQNIAAGTNDTTPEVTQAPDTTPEPTQAPEVTQEPEVTQAPETTQEPEATQAPAPAVTAAPAAPLAATWAAAQAPVAEPTFEERVDAALVNAAPSTRIVIETLRSYREKMRVRTPVTEETIQGQQLTLWKTLRGVISTEEDFQLAFSLVIAYFREYGDREFREASVFRGMPTLNIDGDSLKAFQRLLNLLKLAAGAKSHGDVTRQTDFHRTINERIFGSDGQNRVIAFFR